MAEFTSMKTPESCKIQRVSGGLIILPQRLRLDSSEKLNIVLEAEEQRPRKRPLPNSGAFLKSHIRIVFVYTHLETMPTLASGLVDGQIIACRYGTLRVHSATHLVSILKFIMDVPVAFPLNVP